MSGTGFQRFFDDVRGLHAHPFFAKTGLSNDLLQGEVFPAIRENEVHFYYGGARLCVYKDGEMHSNNRYLDIPDNGSSRDVRIPSDRYSQYRAIKNRCREYRSPNKELSIVSSLFSQFSIAASGLSADRARLLDIECRFPGAPAEPAVAKSKTQDMIDCLFMTPRGTLVFVEVKRADNVEARSSGQRAAVVDQLERYRLQLGSEALRRKIKNAYADAIKDLSLCLEQEDLPKIFTPKAVFERVPLLIVGPTVSSPYSKEIWQRDLLAAPRSLESDIIGLDGRDESMTTALDEFFRFLDGNGTETASQ